LIAVVLALIAASGVVTARAGQVAASPATSGDETIAQRQADLAPLARQLEAIGAHDPDFAMTGIDAASDTVVVYRRNGADGTTASAYQSLRSQAGGTVVVRPALLSAAQTKELMDSVWAARAKLAAAGIEVTQVTTEGPGPVAIGVASLTPAAQALATRYAVFGPGTVVVAQADPIQMASRQNDSAAYYGGGRIYRAGDGRGCSAAFGGHSSGNGADYLLTAYHCVWLNDRRFWDGGHDFMGSATALAGVDDAAAIKVSSDPLMWTGPWDSALPFVTRVTTVDAPRVDLRICTSGSYSGVRCTARVVGGGHFGLTDSNGNNYDAYLFYADHEQGGEIVGHGDSGGPVYYGYSAGTAAVGIISAQMEGPGWTVPCVGDPDPGHRPCSRRVFFGDVAKVASLWDLDLTR
jgi:hypothetical protein